MSTRLLALLLAAAALVAALFWIRAGVEPDREVRARLSLAETMGGAAAAGFARADAPRQFSFPADHGPHPEFRTEWWYLTGNLETPEGRHFGYQLTLFRNALAPEAPAGDSTWTPRDVFMGHFAITDTEGDAFHSFERFARAANGLAGATGDPGLPRAWLEDWTIQWTEDDGIRIAAAEADISLELDLRPSRPPILQGDRGLSQKGSQPGNASYYYSLTRLDSAGNLRIGQEIFRVEGSSWLDREWSTSALDEGQTGWDWFALQLDDGSDLMLYSLRRGDGAADPHSAGALVNPDGRATRILAGDFETQPTGSWTSPTTGAVYPEAWRLRVPDQGVDLEILPVLPDQEHDLSVVYWEGAVRAAGEVQGRPVQGRGYVELTGYPPKPTT